MSNESPRLGAKPDSTPQRTFRSSCLDRPPEANADKAEFVNADELSTAVGCNDPLGRAVLCASGLGRCSRTSALPTEVALSGNLPRR